MEVLLGFLVSAAIWWFFLRCTPGGKQEISTEHLPDTFVVLDLETTGLDASRHEIIEVAAIRYRKGITAHDTYQSLIKPTRKVPSKITELTGITQAMLEQDGKQLGAVLCELTEFVGNLRLVAFNAEFDMAFLHAACEREAIPRPKNKVSCALKMARRAWPRRKSYRLGDLASAGDIADGQAHRALEDARRALIIYAAAVSRLKVHA
jgi:DNA polymerase III subunit epsilon